MLELLSKFNLPVRIPVMIGFFGWALPWLTAGTPFAFTNAAGLHGAILLAFTAIFSGLLFVVACGTAFSWLGMGNWRAQNLKMLTLVLSIGFMTVAFWSGAALFPSIYSTAGFPGALAAGTLYNGVLMVTLPSFWRKLLARP